RVEQGVEEHDADSELRAETEEREGEGASGKGRVLEVVVRLDQDGVAGLQERVEPAAERPLRRYRHHDLVRVEPLAVFVVTLDAEVRVRRYREAPEGELVLCPGERIDAAFAHHLR